ncbi:MAG: hypothetical protein LUD18_03870 [Lachnospiraceae bacterium]|nr:hypothetical protein [Lachnospiraceae bacterium]
MESIFVENEVEIIRSNQNCRLRSEGKNGCRIMAEGTCDNPAGCSFHQTQEEQAASLAAHSRRMNSLSLDEQVYYAGKYYKGKMPWK